MATIEKVSEDQAALALQQLSGQVPEEPEPSAEKVEPEVVEAETAEVKEEPKEEAASEVAESDDVQSLKGRLAEVEAQVAERDKKFEARLQAQQQRFTESERILRDRYLRKSTASDKALRALKAAKSEAGLQPDEADRIIAELEASMHPASASYAPPEPRTETSEDQALVLNRFLNEKGMDTSEADTFGQWIRADAARVLTPAEQAVAQESLDGFLRIAHSRWQTSTSEAAKQKKVDETVAAVKSVQRTQKQAARAAESTGGAPKKQPTKLSEEVDVSKLTPEDVSKLVRQAWEQYR